MLSKSDEDVLNDRLRNWGGGLLIAVREVQAFCGG